MSPLLMCPSGKRLEPWGAGHPFLGGLRPKDKKVALPRLHDTRDPGPQAEGQHFHDLRPEAGFP